LNIEISSLLISST